MTKVRKTTFRGVRTTERTNTLINTLVQVCNKKDLRVNGNNDLDGSALLISPFERAAHAETKEQRVSELTNLLLSAQRLKDEWGHPLPKEAIEEIAKEVFEQDGLR